MESDSDDKGTESANLLPEVCERSSDEESCKIGMCVKNEFSSSGETVTFDSKMVKTSTVVGLTTTWGGRRSQPELGRMRRARSWSGGIQDDVSSEIRILRERLLRTQTRPRPRALRFLSRRQRFTLGSLALVDFMSFCSMSIMAPFFPREATLKGLSDTMCGLVFSFYAIIMFITSPFFGKFLPKVGTKFMFLTGMFVAGTCNVIFGTLSLIDDTVMFTVLCFIVRGLEALGASAYSTASFVFVVNAFPENIGAVLGILEMFVGLGMSVGPAIGGFLYSIGGFGVPFYTLGIVMVITIPINYFLLNHSNDEYTPGRKTGSIFRLFKIPSIIITGLVIVIVSNTWAFLDPTLEPHLRQFNLSTEQIGLIFLLFSALYGIFSLIWGWVADRVHNHWCMMVWGLFLSTVGLILLGPCPFIPGLPGDLWLDLIALSILGISVALTLLPTFQGVLASSIVEGGCPEALTTYSAVAGVWSCCYSLGEVLGPALGGTLAERYGFPLVATSCACACFVMALITLIFFSLRESCKMTRTWESASDSIPYTDSTWNSNFFCKTRSAPDCSLSETSPLLTPCSCNSPNGTYETTPQKHFCLMRKANKSGAASISDVISYFLKFQYLTNGFAKIRMLFKKKEEAQSEMLYQNYFNNNDRIINTHQNGFNNNNDGESGILIPKRTVHEINEEDQYFSFLENVIFGSPSNMEPVNLNHLFVKKNNKGLVPKLLTCADSRRTSEEMLRHNLEKVCFYEQNPQCGVLDDVFEGCECRDDVTFVRGTVALSSTGACEV